MLPAAAPKTDDERPKIVVLGDSLTAGLGLLETQSYPHLLQERSIATDSITRSLTPACQATLRLAAFGGSTGHSRRMCACSSSHSAPTMVFAGYPSPK